MISLIITILLASIDQLTKYLAAANIQPKQLIPLIDNTLCLTYYKNTGSTLHIWDAGSAFFPIGMALLIGVFIYLLNRFNAQLKYSMSLAIAGLIGNFIDKVFKGGGIDFIAFMFGKKMLVINLADLFVVVGTAISMYKVSCILIDKSEEKVKNL